MPVTAEALQGALPPPEQNAATIYSAITAMLAAHPLIDQDGIIERLAVHEMPSAEQFDRVRSALKRQSTLAGRIHQAVARAQCVFVRDWSFPTSGEIKESGAIRSAARLLVAESLLLAHDGKVLDAVRNQALGFDIARHVAPEPYLNGHKNAIEIDIMTLHGLQQLLYLAGANGIVADAVRSTVETRWKPHSLASALQDQAGTDIVDIQRLRTRGPAFFNLFVGDNSSPPLRMEPTEWNTMLDENGVLLLSQQRKLIAVADRPYLQSEPVMSAMSEAVDPDRDRLHVLHLVLTNNYGRSADLQAASQAHFEVTRAAAAILSWRARHGALPMALQEAISVPPVDPFDGNSIRYRREGSGFVVFSVGNKRSFTGGAPDKRPGGLDILFRYPFPQYYAGEPTEAIGIRPMFRGQSGAPFSPNRSYGPPGRSP